MWEMLLSWQVAPEFFGALRLLSMRETAQLKVMKHKYRAPVEDDVSSFEKNWPLFLSDFGTVWLRAEESTQVTLTVPTSLKFSKLMIRHWENNPGLLHSGEKPKVSVVKGLSAAKNNIWRLQKPHLSFPTSAVPYPPPLGAQHSSPILSLLLSSKHPSFIKAVWLGA